MITIFRKIRHKLMVRNKFTTYLLYAIGEIALVVIGILIALQINNWNEEKSAQNNFIVLLKESQKELILNIESIDILIDLYYQKDSIIDKILEKKLTYEDYNSGDFKTYTSLMGIYEKVDLMDDAYINLLQSGVNLSPQQDSIIHEFKKLNGKTKRVIDDYDIKVEEITEDFIHGLRNNKEWYAAYTHDYRSDEIIDYFLNDPMYLNLIADYETVTMENHMNLIVKYKDQALEIHDQISNYLGTPIDTTFRAQSSNFEHFIGVYEGEYKSKTFYLHIEDKNNELVYYVMSGGKPKDVPKSLYLVSENVFTAATLNNFIEFIYNEKGEVSNLEIFKVERSVLFNKL